MSTVNSIQIVGTQGVEYVIEQQDKGKFERTLLHGMDTIACQQTARERNNLWVTAARSLDESQRFRWS